MSKQVIILLLSDNIGVGELIGKKDRNFWMRDLTVRERNHRERFYLKKSGVLKLARPGL